MDTDYYSNLVSSIDARVKELKETKLYFLHAGVGASWQYWIRERSDRIMLPTKTKGKYTEQKLTTKVFVSEIEFTPREPLFNISVILDGLRYERGFQRIYFSDENTIYHDEDSMTVKATIEAIFDGRVANIDSKLIPKEALEYYGLV